MVVVFNKFLSYLLLFVIMVVIAAAGFIVGKKLREHKNAKNGGEN
ncbi:MAG: vanadium nitrogenase [Lachnospiraceae bacterium]|nr:vanadium nitrogenase [Lachnospiraceae bacterium]